MNLYDTLENLRKSHNLDENAVLVITCTDGKVIRGNLDCYISAQDNDPEIAQVDIFDLEKQWLVGILETEIESITYAG